jgi:hypothetical protein
MPKCKDCGFLAIWLRAHNRFQEATELTRDHGLPPEIIQNDEKVFHAKCFIRKYDLVAECKAANPIDQVWQFNKRILEVVDKERSCNGYKAWIQGFSPKEHQEILDKKSERRWQVVHGLLFTIAGGIVALFSQWVAKPSVPVVNISPPAVNITTPPVNVTVRAPDTQQSKLKHSVPPTTTHYRKSQPPAQE